jgi:hypothetical protein
MIDWWALGGAAATLAALLYVVWDLGIGTEPDEPDQFGCPHPDTTYSFHTGTTRCLVCGDITEQEFLD